MKPCDSCPFRKTALLGLWHPAHYLLIAYLGSVRDFVDESALTERMGCHKFGGALRREHEIENPPLCAGWLRGAPRSFAVKVAVAMGRVTCEDLVRDREVMSPETMAEVNGLDMARLPPLSWSPGDPRYPTFGDWTRTVQDLRTRLKADPEYARTFVIPGSPLDIGVNNEQVRGALGPRAILPDDTEHDHA